MVIWLLSGKPFNAPACWSISITVLETLERACKSSMEIYSPPVSLAAARLCAAASPTPESEANGIINPIK